MDNSAKRLLKNKPPLFVPTVSRYNKEGSAGDSYFTKTDSSEYYDTAVGNTGSFKYNIPEDGLKSTQQLNINWTDFKNHTFFNSAQVKTNIAFEKIINEFPFDGTKKEIEIFLDTLTGFEKWIYDKFPKNNGYLFFSGSAISTDTGTIVTVKDAEGSQYPTVSKRHTGKNILDPGDNSLTVETHIYVSSHSLGNRNEYIFSKINSSTNGFGIINEVTTSNSASSSISILVRQGTLEDKVSMSIPFNTWTHVAWIWDRTPGIETIYSYKNGLMQSSSSIKHEFDTINTNGATLYIGSGSSLGSFTPNNTFTGSLDELRIWHTVRSTKNLDDFRYKPIYAKDKLKLYFKFNEPTGSNSNLVIDYSGNSLHGKLNTRGITLGVRDLSESNKSGTGPMTQELSYYSPVLFPNIADSINLKLELLLSGTKYDNENPNLITKLVPAHYFDEGKFENGFTNFEGDIIGNNENGDNPRENVLGSTQIMLSLLYTWAKFFDEMKLYTQAFSTLKKLDYDSEDTMPNDFLSTFARNEGIDLPPLFVGSTIEQYIEGQNLDNQYSYNVFGLQSIQNQVWRRILINLQDIIKSKGTIHSLKSFIRAVGIDPDNNFRIREYGGPTKNPIEFNRETRSESSTMLNFSSSINLSSNQFVGDYPGLITSPWLTSSKTEPSWPFNGPNTNDNKILTSGSFTIEGIYKFPTTGITLVTTQSLARLQLTGSGITTSGSILANLIADKTNEKITLFIKSAVSSSNILSLPLTGVDIFDGQKWNVSFGRVRNDDPLSDSLVSSSYFIRAARQLNGEIYESYLTTSYLLEPSNNCMFQNKQTSTNAIVLKMGNEISTTLTGAIPQFLSSSDAIGSYFQGKVSQIRFWSKYLEQNEWNEHVRYFKSVGVKDPRTNWNFTGPYISESWNRLRLDASTDQIVLETDASGLITLTDFTQNGFNMIGTGFKATSSLIVPELYRFSYISPKIDQGVTSNKVRVRSFQNESKALKNPWSSIAPVNEVNPFEFTTDSTRLSIDFSIIDTLDQDIMTIFSSLDELNNILGDPELLFANEYKGLDTIRELYFNKLQDKINIKGFFEFYKWFDTNIGTFVERLLPRKTTFLGTNFIVESHLLERSKVQYKFEDVYLGEDIRSGLKDKILLRLLTGTIGRY